MPKKTVVIDSLPTSAEQYKGTHAIVAVDVIRATTTATTAVHLGREVYLARDTDEAYILAEDLHNPLFVGELGGNVPYGFHMSNSPVQVAALSQVPAGEFTDNSRPIILVSSSGTKLILNSAGAEAVYLGCARNHSAVASHLIANHSRVALLGAGTRGVFRREDQMVCAWMASRLIDAGFEAETEDTTKLVNRWKDITSLEAIRDGRSAEYLRESGQVHDLEFIIHHVDDLDTVPIVTNARVELVSGRVTQR